MFTRKFVAGSLLTALILQLAEVTTRTIQSKSFMPLLASLGEDSKFWVALAMTVIGIGGGIYGMFVSIKSQPVADWLNRRLSIELPGVLIFGLSPVVYGVLLVFILVFENLGRMADLVRDSHFHNLAYPGQ